ncbi:hypothetical protein BC826DRAFT_981991 [Russula brevipes]|nr:hypothetical protein BC826DRAFT_981991 [Russula brevipes]
MIYTISTPPGLSASGFALQAPAFTPLLAPPFDDGNGLQSNARATSCSEKGKPGSREDTQTQIGLGFLFGGSSDSDAVDGLFFEDLPRRFLDSPPPVPLDAPSPPDSLRLQYPPTPEADPPVIGADLNTSSSAFSIRDWIVNPSSSPAPSDALCGSSTAPQHVESAPDARLDALSLSPDALANFNMLNVDFAAPRTSTGINPDVLVAPRALSPSTDTDGSRTSMATVFLQVIEHIGLVHVPHTSCLSPSETLIPRRDHALPCVSDLPAAQPLGAVFAQSNFCSNTGELFSPPIEASRELASNGAYTVGTASMSPRSALPSNGCTKGLVSPDTPVFNVHEGISEQDLQRRANRYRRRHPGLSLDRHWLLMYAGKLNKDGKAIEDYRCYISGCAQVNKRRDHIIVHICSHVNERPFSCRYCHMTFLRRNECKRHEAGHSGLKPFVCRLCPPPAARFARQDLLTRHARRAHDGASGEQCEKRRRTPEMAAQSRENGPARKRARMAALRAQSSPEICL